MERIYLKIEGRVQRIGFRRWIIGRALEIGGLSGWVRNMEDGSVEILFEGEEASVAEMVKSCYQGPLLARVDEVSVLSYDEFLPPIQEGRFLRL